MPFISIKTGFLGEDGQDEVLSEYLCDWPGCEKVGEQVLGVLRDLSSVSVACKEHAPKPRNGATDPAPAD